MTPGPLLFTRYAYPPNELGYCGPEDHRALLEYGAAAVVDPGLIELAEAFEGAWPYLELIAGYAGRSDPLDAKVVEAYWLGNDLLETVDMTAFGNSLDARFGRRAGPFWNKIADSVGPGAFPHHSFHVFCVYPWVGLLRAGSAVEPLRVLDRCRIRWGRVDTVAGDTVTAWVPPLLWDGASLSIGDPIVETAIRAVDGVGVVPDIAPGEWISLHWGWVCDRLTRPQMRALQAYSARGLELANRGIRALPALA